MRKTITLLIIIWIYTFGGIRICFAQIADYHFDLITEANGLSNRNIGGIMQDHRGYIWFATADGLNRYDGYSFKVYTKIPGDTNSLKLNYTTTLAEDKDHMIWIGLNPGGLSCFDPETEKFTNYSHRINDPLSLQPNAVHSIFVDHENNVWIANAQNAISVFNRKTKTFKKYGPLSDIKKEYSAETQKVYNSVYGFYEDESGLFWLATHDGLYTFDKRTGIFKAIRARQVIPFKWRDDLFAQVLPDSDFGLWLPGWSCGLNYYNRKSNVWINYKYNLERPQDATRNIINSIAWKNKNELWVCTNDRGLGIFDLTKKSFQFFDEKTRISSKLPDAISTRIFIDRDHNTWVAQENGLSLLRSTSGIFSFIPLTVTKSDNADRFGVTSFLKDPKRNRIYVGTAFADGLNIIDENTKKQKHISVPVISNDERFLMVNDLFRDSKGQVWVLTRDLIMQLDEERDKLIQIPQPATDTALKRSPFFVKIMEDADGNFWFASLRSGVYKYNPATKSYIHYKHDDTDSKSICSNNIANIIQDRYKRIWFGSARKGLSMLETGSNSFINYYQNDNDTNFLSNDLITGMTIDHDKNIWLATFGGLSKINTTGKKVTFQNFGVSNGLPSEILVDLECDASGTLWLISTVAMSRINPRSFQIKSYTSRNGFQETISEFNLCPTGGDEMFIGSYGGYYRFYPEQLKANKTPPTVIINSFKIFDHEIPFTKLLNEKKKINLSYKQNFFSFDFAAINFSDPEKNQFAFTLEGLDKNWVKCGARRFASYTNIEGGNYVFKVKTANSDGIWSTPVEIPIHIESPFWKKPWFIFLVAFICALIIYAIYRIRISNIRTTENLKTAYNKKIAEVEMTALRAQMNPHFIFNCLNSINRYIVKSDNKTASLYLTKFSKLIRLILDNSHSKNVVLSNEMEALKLYIEMESLRFDNKFRYEIKTAKNVNPDSIEVPPLIIQPYVENAIWHGLLHKESGGSLLVEFSCSNGMLQCIVEDDGVGRAAAKDFKSKSATTRKSLGMKLTEDRINILNQYASEKTGVEIIDLKNEKGDAIGTRVIIKIPV